ncbi:indolepyruvate oxidoreductase subunit beta [bacterium]|nr:indolepyruvate oxidoreductase subunit beta [bacterium]
MNEKTTNVLIVGVGGQGVVLASNILCAVVVEAGYDVKKSEIHGMSQRGGVVTSDIRFGPEVLSPLIAKGTVDVMMAFEAAEALRFAHEVREGGKLMSSLTKLAPPKGPTRKGQIEYPENPLEQAKEFCKGTIIPIDTDTIARELGNMRLANTILLGGLSAGLDIDETIWTDMIRKMVPPKTIDKNLAAFARGREVVSLAEA